MKSSVNDCACQVAGERAFSLWIQLTTLIYSFSVDI